MKNANNFTFIEKMTSAEKTELFFALEKELGWYSIANLCVDDLKEHMKNNGLDIPSNDILNNACSYVARKYEHDINFALEWAMEYAISK